MPIWTSGATGSSWNDFAGDGGARKAGEEARRDPAD